MSLRAQSGLLPSVVKGIVGGLLALASVVVGRMMEQAEAIVDSDGTCLGSDVFPQALIASQIKG